MRKALDYMGYASPTTVLWGRSDRCWCETCQAAFVCALMEWLVNLK